MMVVCTRGDDAGVSWVIGLLRGRVPAVGLEVSKSVRALRGLGARAGEAGGTGEGVGSNGRGGGRGVGMSITGDRSHAAVGLTVVLCIASHLILLLRLLFLSLQLRSARGRGGARLEQGDGGGLLGDGLHQSGHGRGQCWWEVS